MAKLDGNLMHESLQALCKQGEKYYYPVYGRVKKIDKFSAFPINNIYGFVAVTDMQRLLIAGFTMLGVFMGNMSIPLKYIKSVKIDKTIFGQNSVKMVIDNQGEDFKLNCTFANNVRGMGIPDQKKNLDELLKNIENRKAFQKALESYQKLQKINAVIAAHPNMKSVDMIQQNIQSANAVQHAAEESAPKKVHKGPDFVAMLNREKEYTLALSERLEAKYGKAKFGAPLTESEIAQWETVNQIALPEDLKEWLKFSGESKLKGIPLEFYPIEQFRKEQDYVIIGKREHAAIAFETEKDRYITIEANNRKNLGHMETILRFWYYDAKELFAEEELEKLRPVIEEETIKMEQAQQRA